MILSGDILVLKSFIWGPVVTVDKNLIEILPVNEVSDDEYPVKKEDILYHFRVVSAKYTLGEGSLCLMLEKAQQNE